MSSKNNSANDLGLTLGLLLLRIWLGMRAIQTGIEKFAGTYNSDKSVLIDGAPNSYGLTDTVTGKVYSLSNYHGVPVPLYEKFSSEPLIPSWGLSLYDVVLGPALILLGLTVLFGIATRISLFAMGLVYTSLTFGLILIKQDAGIAWLGVHIIMVVVALALTKYNRFAILKKW
ncbi:MAG: thiosulfate dehydrogenase [quinone] large subunit [Lentimonas sp.]|jgi:thiosulfate dehydrogenase [quinone] large subunit